MKTRRFIKAFIVSVVLLLAGCGHNYQVDTIIYADGSCLRTLTVSFEDSVDIDFFELDHPIPIDTSWNLVIESDTTENGDTIFIHKASKLFESVDQMNLLYANDSGMYRSIDRIVSLNKRFRWFYTFLDYKETYNKLFNQPSLTNYLDSTQFYYAMLLQAEQEKYLKENFDTIAAKQFDKEAEDGFYKWIEFTIMYSCFDAIEESIKNIKDCSLSESNFSNKRDSITNLMNTQFNLFENDDDVFVAIKRVFEIDSISYQKLEKEAPFFEFNEKYRLWEDIFINEDYVNSVQMPGLIIETNSAKISENNEVEWKVGWIKYFTDDFEMIVQSRIVNTWAFWMSGGLILLVLIILIFKRKNKI